DVAIDATYGAGAARARTRELTAAEHAPVEAGRALGIAERFTTHGGELAVRVERGLEIGFAHRKPAATPVIPRMPPGGHSRIGAQIRAAARARSDAPPLD